MAKSTESAADFLPDDRSVPSLQKAAARCQGCDLYKDATQTVFGEGPADARLMLIGETPGDQEDRKGRPFVGPAGRLLDKVLEAQGVERAQVYVTNAVKHFRFTPRGKRRLHAKPSARQQSACHPWLDAELETVDPQVIVCLGATAAQALLGREFRITQARGQIQRDEAGRVIVPTHHPSAVIRAESPHRQRMEEELGADIALAMKQLEAGG